MSGALSLRRIPLKNIGAHPVRAAILAFPTAIAGIYGLNCENMPELTWHYGYYVVLGIIASGCCGLFAGFKRAGWL